ncbi:hypothetical protein VNO78_16065 [Psophocarpus tetragonolobus]|uniref:DUF4283 domain-containing protein n=1 Tax=Psophocarpus tetragonolobus TaxID=3891 RepID=A0AAN9SFM7_PSOTE
MGGDMVLVQLKEDEAVKELLKDNQALMASFFVDLAPRKPLDVTSERNVWIRLICVPIHAWSTTFFQFTSAPTSEINGIVFNIRVMEEAYESVRPATVCSNEDTEIGVGIDSILMNHLSPLMDQDALADLDKARVDADQKILVALPGHNYSFLVVTDEAVRCSLCCRMRIIDQDHSTIMREQNNIDMNHSLLHDSGAQILSILEEGRCEESEVNKEFTIGREGFV